LYLVGADMQNACELTGDTVLSQAVILTVICCVWQNCGTYAQRQQTE